MHADPKIITIPSTKVPNTPSNRNTKIGPITGIIVAALASFAVIALLIYGCMMRKSSLRRRHGESKYIPEFIGSRRLEDQELDSKSIFTPAELQATKMEPSELASDQARHELPTSMLSEPETETTSNIHEMSGSDPQFETQTER